MKEHDTSQINHNLKRYLEHRRKEGGVFVVFADMIKYPKNLRLVVQVVQLQLQSHVHQTPPSRSCVVLKRLAMRLTVASWGILSYSKMTYLF